MTVTPAALPVLAEAITTVLSEIGYNTEADAAYIGRHLHIAGFDVVPRLRDLPAVEPLTPESREVLLLAACELSNEEIGSRLWLSEGAVKCRFKVLFRALGVGTRLGAVMRAVELGHVSVGELMAVRAEVAGVKAVS